MRIGSKPVLKSTTTSREFLRRLTLIIMKKESKLPSLLGPSTLYMSSISKDGQFEILANDSASSRVELNFLYGSGLSFTMRSFLKWAWTITCEHFGLKKGSIKMWHSVTMVWILISSTMTIYWPKSLSGTVICWTHSEERNPIKQPSKNSKRPKSLPNIKWSKWELMIERTPNIVWRNGIFSEEREVISTSFRTIFWRSSQRLRKSLPRFTIDDDLELTT